MHRMHRMSLNHRGASAMLRPTGWKKGDDLKQNLVPSASLWSTRGLFYLETLSGFLFCRMPNFLPNLCPEISGILETTPEKSRELRRNHVQWSRLEKTCICISADPGRPQGGARQGREVVDNKKYNNGSGISSSSKSLCSSRRKM